MSQLPDSGHATGALSSLDCTAIFSKTVRLQQICQLLAERCSKLEARLEIQAEDRVAVYQRKVGCLRNAAGS